MSEPQPLLEILAWDQPGYRPLAFGEGWQVALLNWLEMFDWENAGPIERHILTDEVFVLVRGRALIFVSDGERLAAAEMHPGSLYAVKAGAWHNLLSTRDAAWVIVERDGTHLEDSEKRPMSAAELASLSAQLPGWVRNQSGVNPGENESHGIVSRSS